MTAFPFNRVSWPLLALLASAGMLAAAHAFERFAHLAPCPLCYSQRHVYWAAGALALVGVILRGRGLSSRILFAISILLGLVFLTGFGVASYHSLVEYGVLPAPPTCAVGTTPAASGNLWDALGQPLAVPSCAEAKWHFAGLSMAGWNALVSLGLAAFSFLSASRTPRVDTANEVPAAI
jgi:disulfide bond formation protein DsbB